MAKFEKRKTSGSKPKEKNSTELANNIAETLNNEEFEPVERKAIEWEKVPIVSTGSTLLDLAISGGRISEGGIPCCILMEIHGPSASGKTAVLSEIGSNAQRQNGDIMYMDPEARMDKEYARIYGIELDKRNYHRPDTVAKVFDLAKEWKSEANPKVLLTDSLAALTTDLELSDKGDKMGMRRAKEFSAGFRVNARLISTLLWVCSNQEREGDNGPTTPGGKAIPYYSSLRIRIKQKEKIKLEKRLSSGVKVEKIIGIESDCFITKSTVDDPYRSAPLYIIFGYGIDDIRGNLQYLKDMKKDTTYICPDGKGYMGMEQAIMHVEREQLQKALKGQTIDMWHEIDALFSENKKRKKNR